MRKEQVEETARTKVEVEQGTELIVFYLNLNLNLYFFSFPGQ